MKFAAVGIASGLSGSGNLVGCGQCNIPCETLVLKLEVMMIEKIISRSMHIAYRSGNVGIKICPSKISRYSPVLGSSFIRYINTERTTPIDTINTFGNVTAPTTNSIVENIPLDVAPTSLIDKIPDAPIPPAPEALDLVAAIGEPTFESLGLGGWTPVGIVHQLLELLHVSGGVPWWGTIAIGTVCVRTLIFPLVILSQRNAVRLHNAMPGLQKIQAKISEARTSGDQLDAAKYTQEMMLYMKNNQCNPFKSILVPMAQAPIFISFFFALKKMANLPVDSFRHGGLYWFTDLTVCDPYYILPVLTSATLALTLKLGIEGPKLASMGMFRYVIQAMPIVILPFTINFPAGIVWYWVATNVISTIQVFFLRLPKIRKFFNIGIEIKHSANALAKPKKFKEGFKDSWTNMKLAREMTDRQQIDRIQFNKAGTGPIEKTYSYNPIQEHLKKEKVAAKRR